MDFIPSKTLYERLTTGGFLQYFAAIDRGVLVVPHWEALDCGTVHTPHDFTELYTLAKEGTVRPFHAASSLLIPRAFELSAPPRNCDVSQGAWTFGVRTTDYFR